MERIDLIKALGEIEKGIYSEESLDGHDEYIIKVLCRRLIDELTEQAELPQP